MRIIGDANSIARDMRTSAYMTTTGEPGLGQVIKLSDQYGIPYTRYVYEHAGGQCVGVEFTDGSRIEDSDRFSAGSSDEFDARNPEWQRRHYER